MGYKGWPRSGHQSAASAFAADPEQPARFEREAKLTAPSTHPNIASIDGLGDSEGIRTLVIELVSGPTLAAGMLAPSCSRLYSGLLPHYSPPLPPFSSITPAQLRNIPNHTIRASIIPPSKYDLTGFGNEAISPDGRFLVFVTAPHHGMT